MASKSKIIACKTCGAEIAASAKRCPQCGAKNSKPIFKKWWFWVIIVIFIGAIGSSDSDSGDSGASGGQASASSGKEQQTTVSTNEKVSVFSGDCGISATAEMGNDIIGQPTVSVSITNTTDKDISAIKFYAVPVDVYGEELKGIFSMHYLSTDDTIAAGKSDQRTWQFLDTDVKTVKLYVYSVYFKDGTEWGDREATKSVILKNALEVEVEGVSGK
jgi:RNA polymerase subunit RPABC4/transcription elongation factor Spt4